MPKKKSHGEFIAQLNAANPNVIVLGEYVNSQSHILCQCRICGHQWHGIPNNLLRKEGCPQCARNQRVIQDKFELKMSRIHPNIKITGRYVDYSTHINCVCTVCGSHFSSAPYSLMSGHGCKKCSFARIGKQRTKSHDVFLKELEKVNPGVVPLEEYQGAKKNILCQCTCGNTWYVAPTSLLRGHKCMKCRSERDKKAKDPSAFAEEVATISPTIELLEPYYRSNKKILVRCKICDKQWNTWPSQLQRGDKCPNCIKRMSTSFPEQALFYYLKAVFPDSINSYKDGFGRTELDIYLPSLKTGIEYDGRKWHGDKRQLEISKYTLCRQKGIRLIRIRERSKPEDIGEICDDVIRSDYGDTKRYEDLDLCIKELFNLLNPGLNYVEISTEKHHSSIEANYYSIILDKSLGSLYPEISAEWYQPKNGAITPFMITPKNNNSYYWKCMKCRHIYASVVSNRTAGHGCPKCAGQYRRSSEDFVKEIREINPYIEIVSSFLNTESKITIRCKKCGTTDVLNARSLLNGAGCKQCNYTKLHNDRVMPKTELNDRIAQINPNIEITGKFINAAKRIACKCKQCGHAWAPIAGSILYQSTGCPRCSGRMKKRVLCIETGQEYNSVHEAELKTGIFHSTISKCCNGKGYTAGGYHWRFV